MNSNTMGVGDCVNVGSIESQDGLPEITVIDTEVSSKTT